MWFENSANAWGNYWILYHKTNKEASTVFCSVVKHLGSGRALKKWGKTLDCVSCFPLHFFRALPLPACFTTEQDTFEASLFVKYTFNLFFEHMQSTYVHYKNIRKPISFISLKGGDLIFDTKTLTFAIKVSYFSRWVINLLFRIVESRSTLRNKFWLCCSVITHNLSRIKFAHISR